MDSFPKRVGFSSFPDGRSLDTKVLLSWELKQRRFWATHVNRKWAFFSFSKTSRYRICIAKCLNSYRDDLPKNLFKITAKVCKKSISGWRASLKNVAA